VILRARVLCVALVFVASSAAALPYSNLIVFGDSLVDAGNISIATGGATPNPAQGYFDGRFSNGPVASDVLNQAVEGTLSAPSLGGGDNYAFGGARVINNGDGTPDLAAQVTSYLVHAGGVADPNALYLINDGGNDVFDILLGANQTTRINAVVATILAQLSALQSAGALHFLVAGIGDVGAVPQSIAAGPAVQAFGRAVSVAMSNAIFAALPAGVFTVDVIALGDAVAANPAAFGLPAGINRTTACLSSGSPDPNGPPTCDGYAFFDGVHPASQLAAVMGSAFVAAVPEPGAAWLVALALLVAARRAG
jgi:phospholipase/lecithinase/hemolysin